MNSEWVSPRLVKGFGVIFSILLLEARLGIAFLSCCLRNEVAVMKRWFAYRHMRVRDLVDGYPRTPSKQGDI